MHARRLLDSAISEHMSQGLQASDYSESISFSSSVRIIQFSLKLFNESEL